ncbi:MAG: hypothetical protein CMH83_19525 [Nocardioides sp.]|nr:hypothetical protein [Nocardioides sp.]
MTTTETSAETLRRAAALIHDEWDDQATVACFDLHHEQRVHLAVADLLDDAVENVDLSNELGFDMRVHIGIQHALAVARAYLGEA